MKGFKVVPTPNTIYYGTIDKKRDVSLGKEKM